MPALPVRVVKRLLFLGSERAIITKKSPLFCEPSALRGCFLLPVVESESGYVTVPLLRLVVHNLESSLLFGASFFGVGHL